MSDPYDRGSSSRRRGVLSHWVPLLLTVTIATAGVAAWVWSQRNRDDYYEDEEDEGKTTSAGRPLGTQPNDLDYDHADYGENPAYGAARTAGPRNGGGGGGGGINLSDATTMPTGPAGPAGPPLSAGGWSTRMSDALSATSTPHQWVGSASKAVSAGVAAASAAASAAVGGALASIREGDKDAYADHETWSEEADARKERTASTATTKNSPGRKRKTVAIVVAADGDVDSLDEDGFHEHAVSGLFVEAFFFFPFFLFSFFYFFFPAPVLTAPPPSPSSRISPGKTTLPRCGYSSSSTRPA